MLAAMLTLEAAASDVTNLSAADPVTIEIVRLMTKAAKLDLDIRVVTDQATEHCAYATTRGGQHYIAVNPSCVTAPVVNGRFAPNAVAVLGHELGHIALKHTVAGRNDDEGVKREQLEADEFGGRVVALMNGSLANALAYAAKMSETPSSPRDRGRAEAMEAVTRGWHSVRAQNAGLHPQSWESEGGPFFIHWQSFWMGSAATFLVVVFLSRR